MWGRQVLTPHNPGHTSGLDEVVKILSPTPGDPRVLQLTSTTRVVNFLLDLGLFYPWWTRVLDTIHIVHVSYERVRGSRRKGEKVSRDGEFGRSPVTPCLLRDPRKTKIVECEHLEEVPGRPR